MIYIGECNKREIIEKYAQEHDIKKIYVIGDDLDMRISTEKECIEFKYAHYYKYYYRLLQEVNRESLIVLNECLVKRNRYDLSYNCIKKYLLQTEHRLVFNYFPIIKEEHDFMILYDMIQNNPFLKDSYKYITKFSNVTVCKVMFDIERVDVPITEEVFSLYEKEKEKVIGEVNKDPDIIPRRLLKFSEKYKPKGFDRLDKIKPFMRVAVSPLKVDKYYYGELVKFKTELENVLQRIQG